MAFQHLGGTGHFGSTAKFIFNKKNLFFLSSLLLITHSLKSVLIWNDGMTSNVLPVFLHFISGHIVCMTPFIYSGEIATELLFKMSAYFFSYYYLYFSCMCSVVLMIIYQQWICHCTDLLHSWVTLNIFPIRPHTCE